MRFNSSALAVFVLIIITAMGCSGQNSGPVLPITDPPSQSPQYITDAPTGEYASRALWSYNTITIDTDTHEYELVPERISTGHWNILYWLESSPCTNCVKVKGITALNPGTIEVSIEIRHPFPNPDFTGFDVRGIMMTQGNHQFYVNPLITSDYLQNSGELVNADGHTTLYNVNTFGSGPGGLQGYMSGKYATPPYPNTTLNGFKRFSTPDPNNTRNAFYAGTSNIQKYQIHKPSGFLVIGYAVDACWAPPTSKPVDDPIDDFPSKANCPEPWKITADQQPVGDGMKPDGSGSVDIVFDVYDYQGQGSHFVPTIECPELFDGKKFSAFQSSGAGYSRFKVNVTNPKLAPNGFYMCLITVRDVENDNAPSWLDLTAYKIIRIPVGTTIPSNVNMFTASDADPSLTDRKVQLEWEPLAGNVDWYDIERLDWNWDTYEWEWKKVKSAPHPESSWLDGNPRYAGPNSAIQYRIIARNDAGVSPEFTYDSGYPKLRDIGMALWCAADDGSGNGAVTNWDHAMADFNWANQFWNKYGFNFVLENSGSFFWVTNPEYKNLNGGEDANMHEAFGKANYPGDLNVYYVNMSEGDDHRAYVVSMCPGVFHSTENVITVLAKNASGPPPNGIPITLAHEMGHALGRFFDIYLLDKNNNLKMDDGSSCAADNTFCNSGQNKPPLFCDEAAAYAQEPNSINKNPWNLMWYSAQGKEVDNYSLTDSQAVYAHDWVNGNKANYPFP
ncbi:MAG TPA: fibronectin type III domain-containing protein [bacterium]